MAIGRLRLKKVSYDFPPYRPPSESGSLLLRVTRGCPWNKCRFCSMYRDVTFQRRPLDEIFQDILHAAEYYREDVKTVFIADSNSIIVKNADLIKILKGLNENFPQIERITSYARARTILKKSLKDLRDLRDAGLTRLHVGLESGSPNILEKIRKGITPEEFIDAGVKAKDAGFELSVYVLLGIGGQDDWKEHAVETARVLNRVDPHFIRVRTFQPQPGSEIYNDMLSGVFRKASPQTVLSEQKLMIEKMDVSSEYLSDHITNYLPVNGRLPCDRDAMLQFLGKSLKQYPDDDSMQQRFARKERLKRL